MASETSPVRHINSLLIANNLFPPVRSTKLKIICVLKMSKTADFVYSQAGIEVLLHDENAYGECLQLYKELFTKQTKQVRSSISSKSQRGQRMTLDVSLLCTEGWLTFGDDHLYCNPQQHTRGIWYFGEVSSIREGGIQREGGRD